MRKTSKNFKEYYIKIWIITVVIFLLIIMIIFRYVFVEMVFGIPGLMVFVIPAFLHEYGVVIATILLVCVTYFYYNTNKKTMWHKALLDAKKDYRSPEMMDALQILWWLYKGCDKNSDVLKDIYKHQAIDEKTRIDDEEDYEKRKKLIENSLTYKRRLVLTFYFNLYDLYDHEILSKKMIFDYWDKNNLKIIPNILKPIHLGQAEIDDPGRENMENTEKHLEKLLTL